MFKWQNSIAVSLIMLGVLGIKWGGQIGAIFQSPGTYPSSTQPLSSSLTDRVKQSVSTSNSEVFYVDLLSLGLLATGVVWLTRRARRQQTNSRLVLDFSKGKSKPKAR